MKHNIALIKNLTSRLNKKEDYEFEEFANQWLGKNYCIPISVQEVMETVKRFALEQVDCIIIDGGDGTISHVMTAIYHVYSVENMPRLVILPSGNTNLIAKDIGFGVRGVQALRRIKILAERGRLMNSVQHRHALQIEWSDTTRPAMLGMFQGTAAFTRAINIAHGPTVLKHFPHDWAVAATIIASLMKLVFPKTRNIWFHGEECTMQFDQHPPNHENSFLFLATTLQSFSHRIWPFWGGKSDDQRLHYLNVKPYPPKLLLACMTILCGRIPKWLKQNPHYQSGIAQKITLNLKQDIILDGEHFDTGDDHHVFLSVGPEFSFVRL